MKQSRFICRSETHQMAMGAVLAASVELPMLVFLKGDLGTGKTTLARGIIQASGFSGAVRSPTYTIMEPYTLPGKTIYHLDLYRLADGEELEYLGLRDILAQADALILIEWPENAAGWLPKPDLVIDIKHQTDGRELILRIESDKGITLIDKVQGGFSD